MASFQQVREYVTGVLKGLFPNKKVLDKFGESNGTVTYDGKEISSTGYTVEEIQTMIGEIWSEFNKNHPDITPSGPVTPVEPQEITSNFITSQNKVIITDDKKIFSSK